MVNFLYVVFIVIGVYFAKKSSYLSVSGSVAASFVGIGIALGFQYKGLLLLAVFFLTSSILSEFKKDQKQIMEDKLEKGSKRDYMQVMANGGIAAIVSIIYFFTSEALLIIIFAILIASSNSDTWASEIGSLSKKRPISLRNFRLTDAGTSGAVSLLGTIAGLFGSLLIAIFTFFLFSISFYELLFIFFFGFIGNVIDTLLGAFLQAEYKCKKCSALVEKKSHCGRETEKVKGLAFLTNDAVNLLSGLFAAILGMLLLI